MQEFKVLDALSYLLMKEKVRQVGLNEERIANLSMKSLNERCKEYVMDSDRERLAVLPAEYRSPKVRIPAHILGIESNPCTAHLPNGFIWTEADRWWHLIWVKRSS